MNRLQVLIAMLLPCVAHAFDVDAASAIVIDGGSGKVLWSKNPDAIRYPASTTKIMTCMLLLEHCRLDDVITAPADVEKVKESSMHLKPGEKVSVRDMLYALMLRSANDGCYAVAVHVAGSVEAFAKMMNDRAREIGCTHTHFANPNGLNDTTHYTTAHDLALIGREAMRNPVFREVVRTTRHEIERSINTRDRTMVNHDRYLKVDPTADGIKTGYTVPAGHCFVGSATRNGFHVITVVLKSKNWQADHKKLLDMAYSEYQVQDIIHKTACVSNARVLGGIEPTVPVEASRDIDIVSKRGTKCRISTRFEPQTGIFAPIHKGQRMGEFVVSDSDGNTQRVPAEATSDVPTAQALKTERRGNPMGSLGLIGVTLGAGALYMRGRGRRISKPYGRPRTRPL